MPNDPKKRAGIPGPSDFDPGATDILVQELVAGDDTIMEELSESSRLRLSEAVAPTDPVEDAFDYAEAL